MDVHDDRACVVAAFGSLWGAHVTVIIGCVTHSCDLLKQAKDLSHQGLGYHLLGAKIVTHLPPMSGRRMSTSCCL
jgi:hypothetical protein